ncbi:hypothetical protein JOB18_028236 [Solea senegalensis]|uniref:Uncharacterized protein n=1 Tax=Solea senegalensis TaxID=28829 RepID=A0AAV6SZW6_SOLSE|nr:hypothetical protein JOB18_028236 [Solea senegalensis]
MDSVAEASGRHNCLQTSHGVVCSVLQSCECVTETQGLVPNINLDKSLKLNIKHELQHCDGSFATNPSDSGSVSPGVGL